MKIINNALVRNKNLPNTDSFTMFAGKARVKFIISCIWLLFLIEYSFANVIRSTAESTKNSHINSTATKANTKNLQDKIPESAVVNFSLELAGYIFQTHATTINETLYALKEIFENVSRDAYAFEGVTWKYIQAEVEPFKKFITQLKEIENNTNNNNNDNNTIFEKFDLIADIVETLKKYNNTTLISKSVSEEVAYVAKLLKKYHLEALYEQMTQKAEIFEKNLLRKAYEIWKNLTAVERGNSGNLRDWLEHVEQSNELIEKLKADIDT